MVTKYCVMGEPPSLSGASHVTNKFLPGVANRTFLGAPGAAVTLSVVTFTLGFDTGLLPTRLVAITST